MVVTSVCPLPSLSDSQQRWFPDLVLLQTVNCLTNVEYQTWLLGHIKVLWDHIFTQLFHRVLNVKWQLFHECICGEPTTFVSWWMGNFMKYEELKSLIYQEICSWNFLLYNHLSGLLSCWNKSQKLILSRNLVPYPDGFYIAVVRRLNSCCFFLSKSI